MRCLDRFRKKMEYAGGTLRDEKIMASRSFLKETFQDDPSLSPGIYFWEPGKLRRENYEGHSSPITIRLYRRAYSAANGHTVKFQTEHGIKVVVGDVLFDTVHDEFYLCTEAFDMDSIHYQGRLTLCNWILKWQDETGNILEYPCYEINSTQYNSGETAKPQFTVGTAQHMIKLPCDKNTVVLDTPKRFFLDKNKKNPTAYIVTQNDTTTYNIGKKGIVQVTVQQYPRDDKRDNLELGICDYIDPADNSAPGILPAISSGISYETRTIKSGGDPQLFVGKFFDENKNEIKGAAPRWTIICGFKDSLEVKESGNEIWIGVDDESCIDEEFRLIFSDMNGNYSSAIIVRIDSLL